MSAQAAANTETFDCRQAFAEELIALAREDSRVVAVCNDSVGSSNLGGFRDEFGDRLINVGIAEQNMVGVGAGLSNGGMIPFVSAAAPFLTARALEQIKADAAYSDVHMVLCGQSPGMAYGELGPTHHSIEDLSLMRAIANLTVLVPADPVQTAQAVRWAAAAPGPVYMRVPRFKVPVVTPPDAGFGAGKSLQLTDGDDATVIAVGTMVSKALQAAAELADKGVGARVINMASVAPLDEDAVLRAASQTKAIVTVEEASVSGGLGAAVASIVVQKQPVPMRILGINAEFAPTGSNEYLLDHFGLNPESIVRAVLEISASDVG
jgi:transketolase